MDETAAPEVPAVPPLTREQRKAIAAANRKDRAADAKAIAVASNATYIVAILATVLAVQGMILFWHEVVGLVMWAAVILAGVLEGTLVCAALWDRAAAIRGRSTRATATWLVATASGVLAGIHELAEPMPGGGSEWVLEPFTILAATVRVIPPLLAAWLWHKLLVEAGHTAEGRTTSEVRRAKRMHRYARLAHTQRTIEKQIDQEQERAHPSEKRLASLHAEHAKIEAAARKAYDRVLQVMPGTDPRLPLELDQWARAIAAGDTMVAMTDARIEDDVQTAAAVMQVPGQPKQQRRRQAPAAPARRPIAVPQGTASSAARPAPTAAPAPAGPRPVVAPVPDARPSAVYDQESPKALARALFDAAIADDPTSKPDAARIHREVGIAKDVSTTRRWVQRWFDEHMAALGDPAADRDDAQLAAEAAQDASGEERQSA